MPHVLVGMARLPAEAGGSLRVRGTDYTWEPGLPLLLQALLRPHQRWGSHCSPAAEGKWDIGMPITGVWASENSPSCVTGFSWRSSGDIASKSH